MKRMNPVRSNSKNEAVENTTYMGVDAQHQKSNVPQHSTGMIHLWCEISVMSIINYDIRFHRKNYQCCKFVELYEHKNQFQNIKLFYRCRLFLIVHILHKCLQILLIYYFIALLIVKLFIAVSIYRKGLML